MSNHAPASIKPLTSLRGFAALWVYLYHQVNVATGNAVMEAGFGSGYFGVDIFFILSGFIISYVHVDDFAAWKGVKTNMPRFLLWRLCRIYPLHLVTLLLFVLMAPSNFYEREQGTAADFVRQIFLMQAWTFPRELHWNIPSWSISVEWLIYLCFPLFVCAMGAMVRNMLFNALLLCLAVWGWANYFYATGLGVIAMGVPGLCVLRGLLDFIMGVALHNLYRQGFLKRLPWDVLAVAIFLGFPVIIWLKSRGIAVHDLLVLLLSALLIYSFAHIRSFGHYLFSNRVAVYLGTISYSFYMLHWFYLLEAWEHREIMYPQPEDDPLNFVWRTLGLIGLSALSFHFFENPVRKWAHRMAPRPVLPAA